ncbi:MAG: glycogen synthase GlgA, partial [Clostridia bacterium]|nr:glycogen synthase GlgA [Clostridia bacterium]
MKILLAASECVPFVKTGGLADVAGALPIELVRQGADARVVLPKYRIIDEYWRSRMEHVCHFELLFGWQWLYCGVEKVETEGVTWYFIDNQDFFSPDSIYGDGLNEGLRFAFFCRAVLEMLPRIDFFPDILHCNDWQTGLIPAMLKTQYIRREGYGGVKTLFSIHNLKYQGLFNWKELNGRTGFEDWLYSPQYLEFYGCMSCMKGGLVFADRLLTVSPSYAEEIRMPYYGELLDGLMRERGNAISGILNGIDTVVYDPATDRFLAHHYSAEAPGDKAKCKAALQAECGLAVSDETPLIGFIARLSPQKGLDLIECVLDDMLRLDLQLVFLGKGDRRFEDLLNWASWRYGSRVHTRIALDEGLAHRIYAGADMFLMPSQYEPCGLSQMISLRYGTVPIVRETGGLKDSIIPYNQYTDEGTGFSFANYNAHEMLHTIERAVRYYHEDKPLWARLQKRGMQADFSWRHAAGEYMKLYASMRPQPPSIAEAAAGAQK